MQIDSPRDLAPRLQVQAKHPGKTTDSRTDTDTRDRASVRIAEELHAHLQDHTPGFSHCSVQVMRDGTVHAYAHLLDGSVEKLDVRGT